METLTLCGPCALHWGTTAVSLWLRRCCASLRHISSSGSSCEHQRSSHSLKQSRRTWSNKKQCLTCSSSILAEAALCVCAASGQAEHTGALFQQLPAVNYYRQKSNSLTSVHQFSVAWSNQWIPWCNCSLPWCQTWMGWLAFQLQRIKKKNH